ncbi:hypothetical protein C8J57DRAFT_1507700 [Mycena rebaudengoi]|nr:hypothetical protein C8J57DRAFT_1507700 [Mycena rebaudengoi]
MAKRTSTAPKGKSKQNVRFSATARTGKRRSSPTSSDDDGSRKKQRTSTDGSAPTSSGTGNDGNEASDEEPAKRLRNPWGILPKEVKKKAKPTKTAFQRLIRAMCGLLTQNDVLPSAVDTRKHFDKHFKDVPDHIDNAKRTSGPIADDVACIPEEYLASVFTMVLKAGLQGFVPDVEGPVQSAYNQLHRHLAVSAFQFLSKAFALHALNNTKKERRRPGSLSESIVKGVAYKARSRVADTRFKTARRLELRKPVQRMAYVNEVHSHDEHSSQGRRVREKPGCNPVLAKFLTSELDVKAEEYRLRNPNRGQKKPDHRKRDTPLLAASAISIGLPAEVPIDFFTPAFYNALTVKERARYADTGVAFRLEKYAFAPEHAAWKKMGKAEFMTKYGNEVLKQYNIPSEEEIDELSDSEDEDEAREEEINLVDTDSEMEVDDELAD